MDSAIRMAIINEVRTALRAVSEQLEERYVTAEELSKQFSFFTREWIKDYEETDPGHRHISHLFGLFPGDQINESNPEIYEAAKRTITNIAPISPSSSQITANI